MTLKSRFCKFEISPPFPVQMFVFFSSPKHSTCISVVWKWKSLSCVWLFVTPWTHKVHGILPARILEWVAIPFLQGTFPTQGLNPGLLHCRSQHGSLRILECVAYPFSSRSSQPRNWTRVSCIAGQFLTSWATRGGVWKVDFYNGLQWCPAPAVHTLM